MTTHSTTFFWAHHGQTFGVPHSWMLVGWQPALVDDFGNLFKVFPPWVRDFPYVESYLIDEGPYAHKKDTLWLAAGVLA